MSPRTLTIIGAVDGVLIAVCLAVGQIWPSTQAAAAVVAQLIGGVGAALGIGGHVAAAKAAQKGSDA